MSKIPVSTSHTMYVSLLVALEETDRSGRGRARAWERGPAGKQAPCLVAFQLDAISSFSRSATLLYIARRHEEAPRADLCFFIMLRSSFSNSGRAESPISSPAPGGGGATRLKQSKRDEVSQLSSFSFRAGKETCFERMREGRLETQPKGPSFAF
jgi:hypothetical protein